MEIVIAVVGLRAYSRCRKFLNGKSEVVNWENKSCCYTACISRCLVWWPLAVAQSCLIGQGIAGKYWNSQNQKVNANLHVRTRMGDHCEDTHRMQRQGQETCTHRGQFRVNGEPEQEQSEWDQGNCHEKSHEGWYLTLFAASWIVCGCTVLISLAWAKVDSNINPAGWIKFSFYRGRNRELKMSRILSYATQYKTSKDGKVGMIPKRTVKIK